MTDPDTPEAYLPEIRTVFRDRENPDRTLTVGIDGEDTTLKVGLTKAGMEIILAPEDVRDLLVTAASALHITLGYRAEEMSMSAYNRGRSAGAFKK